MIEVQIKSLMTKPPVTLKSENNIGDAIKLMKEKVLGSIVIVDEDNFPVSIFTEHDILFGLDNDFRINPKTKLGDLPPKIQLITILDTESLDDAIKIFTEKAIHHLVVIDMEGFVKGIISTKDVIKAQKRLNSAFPYFPQMQEITP